MALRKWIYVVFKGETLNAEELMDVFCPFGELLVGKIIPNHHAYVKFRTEENAARAAATMDGCVIDGKGPIEVKIARLSKKVTETVPEPHGKQSNSTREASIVTQNTTSIPKETPIYSNALQGYFEPINEDMIREIHPFILKDMLAVRLLPLVTFLHPELADKLTGMVVELDSALVLKLLKDSNALKYKVEQAAKVLQDYRERRRTTV